MNRVYTRYIRMILLIVSFIFFVGGMFFFKYNVIFVGILFLFLQNVIFCLEEVKERIVLLTFLGTFFLFLMGRPFVGMLRGQMWWNLGAYSKGIDFALSLITAALFFIYIGAAFFAPKIHIRYKRKTQILLPRAQFNYCLQLVAFAIFSVAILASAYEGLQKLIFMQNHSYLDFYTSYNAKRPLIINGFIQLMRPTLCVYLAAMPKKKNAAFVLALYFLTTIPSLRVGMRSPTMLACLFIFTYYFLRDDYKTGKEKHWIGIKEKFAIIAFIPPTIIFLLLYVKIRNGQAISKDELDNPLLGFLYQQGISFDVLAQAYTVFPELWNVGFPGFILGPIWDNVRQSFLIRIPLHLSVYQAYTSEFLQHSHDLKAILSYLVMGDKYFQGHGVGTSYLLDIFADLGWVGIAIINFILGGILLYLVVGFRDHWLIRSSIIYSVLTLFYMPRSNLMECMVQLFSPYFWLGLFFCWLGALLLYRKFYKYSYHYTKNEDIIT